MCFVSLPVLILIEIIMTITDLEGNICFSLMNVLLTQGKWKKSQFVVNRMRRQYIILVVSKKVTERSGDMYFTERRQDRQCRLMHVH